MYEYVTDIQILERKFYIQLTIPLIFSLNKEMLSKRLIFKPEKFLK